MRSPLTSPQARTATKFLSTTALALLGCTGLAPLASAQTFYTADSSNATISTVSLSAPVLGNAVLLNPSTLTLGANPYRFAVVLFTPTQSGQYYFGQTFSPVDTVMILYSGVYDPTNPGAGALIGNDDTPNAQHAAVLGQPVTTQCGPSTAFCPQVVWDVTAGQTYSLFVSVYSGPVYNSAFDLPFDFYSTGTVVFGQFTGRTPINLAQPFYDASQLGVTVDPIFVGGTLKMDQANTTYTQGFTLANFASNTIDQNGNHSVFSGVLSDAVAGQPGQIVIANSGTGGSVTFTGANTYTGSTTVQSGATLDVEGSIASSDMTTVNAGGTLTGAGTVGNTTITAGGALAPGNGMPGSSMTVAGNLAFQPGALYQVQVNQNTSSLTDVSGTATLGGTVNATFAGSNVQAQYTILTAAGGVGGTFDGGANTNLPAGFQPSLRYDANNAYLDLTLNLTSTAGLDANERNVASTLDNYFASTGSIPLVFGALTRAGLTQVDGQLATGSQQTTFDAMNQFMGLIADPSIAGRDNGSCGDAAAAANLFRKVPQPADCFTPHWNVWAAGYGGGRTTDGNAMVGSNSTTSRVFGTAVGADIRLSTNTWAGFALAGGGTNFGVANGLGSGRSDLFQAGGFISRTVGAAYVTGALAYGWQDITTDRTLTFAGIDRLQARFKANAFSGRLESGYRLDISGAGLTPYAAGQFTTFALPGYAEQTLVGANTFALDYASQSPTAWRSELGLRADRSFAMADGLLTLRGRAAWAHDFNPNWSTAATFQALPGASFVVNGASQGHESALTTASAEMKWRNGLSLAATFDGEFSNVTRAYAGKAVLRYEW